MPILLAGQRRYLLGKKLDYLFSYDVAWPVSDDDRCACVKKNDLDQHALAEEKAAAEQMERSKGSSLAFMAVPGGLRMESHLRKPEETGGAVWAGPDDPAFDGPFAPWSVYHVHDDISVDGNDAITGDVLLTRDSMFLPFGQKFGTMEGCLLLKTSDGAVIESHHRGSVSVGALGIGHFDFPDSDSKSDSGTDRKRRRGEAERPMLTRIRFYISPRFDTAYSKYRWLTQRQCAGFGVVDILRGAPARATVDIYSCTQQPDR